jgi:hypothetical protein
MQMTPGIRALCPVSGAPGAASTVQNYKAAAAAVGDGRVPKT